MSLDRLVPTLERLVDDDLLPGWVAGVADDTATVVRSGGHRWPGGPAMTDDTQVVLSSSTKPMAAALALRLVELGTLELDEPVDPWLPELAAPRVLVSPEADLTATVPADRPIIVRDLLTMTPGFGWVSEPGPLASAVTERRLEPGPWGPPMGPDEFMAELGDLPLANQPGRAWRYHTSTDVLSVLLSRASGRTVTELLDEHLLHPLALSGTTFTGDPDRMARIHTADGDGVAPFDVPTGTYVEPPPFESLAAGLVSTVPDQMRFLRSLVGGPTVLSAPSLTALRVDTLTDERRRTATGFIEPDCGWGLGLEIRRSGLLGWAGGMGTIGYADPATGRVGFLATQVTFDAPGTTTAFERFWQVFD